MIWGYLISFKIFQVDRISKECNPKLASFAIQEIDDSLNLSKSEQIGEVYKLYIEKGRGVESEVEVAENEQMLLVTVGKLRQSLNDEVHRSFAVFRILHGVLNGILFFVFFKALLYLY